MTTFKFRRFKPEDNIRVCEVFARSLSDLLLRAGDEALVDLEDPQDWQRFWDRRKALFNHLSRTGDSWLAEDNQRIVGYARSICRDGLRQLTEFFVLPEAQGQGVGRGLLQRAFASEDGQRRLVVATTDGGAIMRYIKSGVQVQSVVFDFEKSPEPEKLTTDLGFESISQGESALAVLNAIDTRILGFTRETEHRWLLNNRAGFFCRRDTKVVGYGFVGREDTGPFALLSPDDIAPVLGYAENLAAESNHDEFWLMVPLANHHAMDYVAARGFEMDQRFPMLLMTDDPRIKLDRYVMTLPGFFI